MSLRPLHEVLEARHMLTATGFPGNECAPDLDLAAITPRSAMVGQPITLNLPALGATLTDEDADGNPTGDALRWLADPDTGVDFPTGATLTPAGVFTWTPTAAQMGQHVITIIGIDAGTPALADAETFIINVGENMAPNLAAIADQNATVGQELVVNVTATDPNPGQTLAFALDPDNAPSSATIEKTGDTTARIRWTPTVANVGAPVNFSVLVTDNGTPQLSDSESFSVTVTAPNAAPDLAAIADQEVTVGEELVVNVTATDVDAGQTLTFALDPENSPAGATITKTGATTATIRWTPGAAGTTSLGVIVVDNGLITLADFEEFTVSASASASAPDPASQLLASLTPALVAAATSPTTSISDSGGFEGSNQTLQLSSKGGVMLTYSYQHFSIPDNFIIRYEGKTLLETGFVGSSRSGMINVPAGSSDTVQIVVATNNSGTAWNYTVEATACPVIDPYVVELEGGSFITMVDGDGNATCSGTGTIYIGYAKGTKRMIRVDGSVEFSKSGMTVNGTVTSLIGTGEVLSAPLFTGGFKYDFQTRSSSAFTDSGAANQFKPGGVEVEFSSISLDPDGTVSLTPKFAIPPEFGIPDFLFSGPDGLIIAQGDVRLGPSVEASIANIPTFELFGFLDASISQVSVEYVAPENAIKLKGKLNVDLLSKGPEKGVEINLADDNYIQIKGGQVDVKGELNVQNPFRLENSWGLRELKLEIDTIKEEVSGTAKLTFPFGRTTDVAGTIGFQLPPPALELNELGLAIGVRNVPIPQWPGVFFQELRGKVTNFAESDPDPIEYSGGVTLTYGPLLFGSAAIRFDGDVTFSSEMVTGNGKITIVNDNVFEGVVTQTLDWAKKYLKATGSYNILDGLITTSDSLKLTSGLDFTMGGTAAIGIPESIPFIGGKQIASGSYLVHYSNDNNLSNDYGAGWGTVTLPLGIDRTYVLGAKVFFDGRVERIGNRNIPQTGSWDLASGTNWVVLFADWENATSADVPVRVQLPDGTWIEEADFAANDIAIIPELGDATTKAVQILAPEAGHWDFQVVDPTGLGAVTYDAFQEAVAPTVSIVTPDAVVPGGSVNIEFDAFDPDSQAEVRLFYDDDNSGFDGVEITRGIVEQDGRGSYDWSTIGVATGEYYVYAMVSDDDNAPVYSYSTGRVQVTELADLSVSHAIAPNNVHPGDALTYSFTIENLGISSAVNPVATLTLPADIQIVSTSLAPISSADNVLVFDLADLAPDQNQTIDIQIVAPGTTGTIFGMMEVVADSSDPVASNDVDVFATLVEAAPILLPDLEVTLSQPFVGTRGQATTYELTVSNVGDGPATNVVLTEALPITQANFISAVPSQGTVASVGADGKVRINLGSLDIGEEATVAFTILPIVGGDLVTTTVVESSETDLSLRSNNLITVGSVELTAPTEVDLSLTANASTLTPAINEQVTLTFTLNNAGPGVASGIEVTVSIPSGLRVDSFSAEQGVFDANTGIWDVGNVRDNLSRTLTVTATVVDNGRYAVAAEVTKVFENDLDSTPGNGVNGEDDTKTLEIIGGTGDRPFDLDLDAIQTIIVTAGQPIAFNLFSAGGTITSLDQPMSDLRVMLDPDIGTDTPLGATITASSDFSWTPARGQVGTHTIRVIGLDRSIPALTDAESFQVIVEANQSPDLQEIANQTATVGVEFVIVIAAADANASQTLTFELDTDISPSTATLVDNGDRTATLRWTPDADDANEFVTFGVKVTDGGVPALADFETFAVAVDAAFAEFV